MSENANESALVTPREARALGLPFDEPAARSCPHCGSPVEPLGVAVGGRVSWVAGARCGCEGEADAARRSAEARRRDAEESMARRVADAGIPVRYRGARVESAEIARWLAGFPRADGGGLYLHGGVGAGKTHAASALARALVYGGAQVVMTSSRAMLDAISAGFSGEPGGEASARFERCGVLVLDDLGKENANGWAAGAVYQVVNARYESLLPTVVTSQYGPGALSARLARGGEAETAEAVASRLRQACAYVHLGGGDRRRA